MNENENQCVGLARPLVKPLVKFDTATCCGCQSTAITCDIELTSDLISEISKFTGKSESQFIQDLNVFADKLTKD